MCASAFVLTSCKKEGCTDSKATNYSSEAKKDDGSCVYETVTVITTPFTAKVDGAKFVHTQLTGTKESIFGQSSIKIRATMGDKYIEIKVPAAISVGTYSFDDHFTGTKTGMYFDGYDAFGAIQGAGSLKIVSKTASNISGTFSFNASPTMTSSGSGTHVISEGQFKVDYN